MLSNLKREIIRPVDEGHWLSLRDKDITSTDASVLLGVNKYKTIAQLYYEKTGQFKPNFKDSEPAKWGRRLEAVVAAGIAEDNNLGEITQFKDYVRIPDMRIGSSFDYFLGEDGIFEIKTVGSEVALRDWIIDETSSEASLYIEAQVQWQLAITGRKYCKIGALVGGNKPVLIHRERDETVIKILIKKSQEFWELVDRGTPPPFDFNKDCEFIKQFYSFAEPNKVLDATGENGFKVCQLVEKYSAIRSQMEQLKFQMKPLELKLESIKAEILAEIKDHEKVKGKDFTISAGVVGEAPVSYIRQPYRNFKLITRKTK